MARSSKMRAQVTCAALAGFGLCLYFTWQFPFYDASDTKFYDELARNWLHHGIYGLELNGRIAPVDMRTPGYPAFLAVVYRLFGHSMVAVMVAQAVVAVATCFLIAAMAALIAPAESRRRAALAAMWLAALCPLTANYTAVVLTETLAIFFTALALLVFVEGLLGERKGLSRGGISGNKWFLGGIVAGIGTLVRPETPLVLAAAGLALAGRWWKPASWAKLARAGVWMAAGLTLPLLPWAARNWQTLGKVQFLSPRYGELPGEFVPRGFYAWTKTWLWHVRDVYLVPWKLDGEAIDIKDVPESASDSPAERARVARLIERYDETKGMSPAVDRGFGELAQERTGRNPLRTYLEVPFLRALSTWFTPRVEMLPYSGRLWPASEMWDEDPVDFSMTVFFGLFNFFYIGLAVAGAWLARRRPGVAFLLVFILLRTAFLTQIETPEPRYMLECFPALLALAAQFWAKGGRAPAS